MEEFDNKQMLRGLEILTEIEAMGIKEKQQKLECVHANSVDHFIRRYLQLALDPYISYGVTVNPKELPRRAEKTEADFWGTAEYVLGGLQERRWTGLKAKRAVRILLEKCSAKVQPWMVKLLNKEVKIGFPTVDLNEIWPDTIRPVLIQKAGDIRKVKRLKALKRSVRSGNWTVEPALSGHRCLIICDPLEPRVISASGQVLRLKFYPEMLAERAMQSFGYPVVLDAEVCWCERPSTKKKDALMWCFDSLKLEDFLNGQCSETQNRRRSRMVSLIQGFKSSLHKDGVSNPEADHVGEFLQVVKSHAVKSLKHAWRYAKAFLKRGSEGAVLKDTLSSYDFRLSRSWLKIIPKGRR